VRAVDPAVLLEAMSDGMYVVDRDRRITYWNASATRITGYTAAEAAGRFCGDGLLNHVDECGTELCGTRCPLKATIRDGVSRTAHVYLHHKDGHVAPVRISAAPLRDGDGTIVGAVETFIDDAETTSTNRRLQEAEQLALLDPLTGVGNRRYLERVLQRRFADWSRERRRFGVLMLDVDRFKTVNDTHGHDAGDAVLTVMVRSLSRALRHQDELCRYGGEEFAVVTGPATARELEALAKRLLMVVRESRFSTAGGDRLPVTISIGGALVVDGDDPLALVRRADQLLLRAKHEGRDRAALPLD
jgi:diguanylate cyclase (GGDEF)-like protein/PAS domain S-box-containing protein